MLITSTENHSEVGLDFVPMVDVLFNLLIFFLIATSMQQAEREMHIALPQAAASGPLSTALREIIINVDAEGRAIVAAKPISDEDLAAMIREAAARNPDQKVSVRGDRTTAYANIARVLDICKGAGIAQPYLETIPTK